MILKGDCIEVMKAMKPSSVDAIVTDPPYGLEFMGKEWDKLEKIPKGYIECKGEKSIIKKKMPRFHQTVEHNSSMQLWHTQWLTEAYRVLKPGASMLVMGGTRTSHRLACAIEDSGFIIKDTLMWIYGSGFPKAQDLGKMIDKRMDAYIPGDVSPNSRKSGPSPSGCYGEGVQHKRLSNPQSDLAKHWDGFKVGGIKPAYEPIIWAVKPPEGSYVDNVLKWGVGAVNVDECRIEHNGDLTKGGCTKYGGMFGNDNEVNNPEGNPKGRFPANVILSHHPECVQVGMKRVKQAWSDKGILSVDGFNPGRPCKEKPGRKVKKHCDSDGYETVESWDCHPDCAVRLLDEQSGKLKSGARTGQISKPATNVYGKYKGKQLSCESSSGGASRFFKHCDYGQEEWLCHENCALRQLDEQSGILKSGANPERRNSAKTKTCYGEFEGQKECISYRGQNSGGASRFLYCAKASRGERNAGLEGMPDKLHGQSGGATQVLKEGKSEYIQKDHIVLNKIKIVKNNHPTVKPIKLFEWLIKLVTREGQIVLDPFIGSGTTAIATHNTGRKCVGIEKEPEYLEIAKRRVAHWKSQPKQMEMRV